MTDLGFLDYNVGGSVCLAQLIGVARRVNLIAAWVKCSQLCLSTYMYHVIAAVCSVAAAPLLYIV